MFYRIENGLAMFILSKPGVFERAQKLRSKEAVLQFIKTEIPGAYRHCQLCFETFVDEGELPVMDWSIYRRDYITFTHWENIPNLSKRFNRKVVVEGFLALGDSVASLNPYYGQGIAMVCESCLALHDSLKRARLTKKKHRSKHHYPAAYTFDAKFSHELQMSFYHMYGFLWFVDGVADTIFYPEKTTSIWVKILVSPLVRLLVRKSLEACETDPYVLLTIIRFQNMLLNWKTIFDLRFLWHIFFPSSGDVSNMVH